MNQGEGMGGVKNSDKIMKLLTRLGYLIEQEGMTLPGSVLPPAGQSRKPQFADTDPLDKFTKHKHMD